MRKNQVKTMESWHKSNTKYFEEFFCPGDRVGKDVVDYFANCQSPVIDWDNLMQAGEAFDCVNGRTTFITFSKDAEGWVYCGDCYKGEKTSAK